MLGTDVQTERDMARAPRGPPCSSSIEILSSLKPSEPRFPQGSQAASGLPVWRAP